MKLFTVVLMALAVLTGQSNQPKPDKPHIYDGAIPCVGVWRVSEGQRTAVEVRKKSDNSLVETLAISERTIYRVGVRDVPNDEQFIAVIFIEVSKINKPQPKDENYRVYAIRPKVLEELKTYFGEAKTGKKPA